MHSVYVLHPSPTSSEVLGNSHTHRQEGVAEERERGREEGREGGREGGRKERTECKKGGERGREGGLASERTLYVY